MDVAWSYWLWTTGNITASLTIALDWRQTYLLTGGLTHKQGGDYARVYLATVCSYSGGDVVLCGVRDIPNDAGLGLTEFLSGVSTITIKLRTTGGSHRAEGAVYRL